MNIMASRTALMLDFDGVLMRNRRVQKFIGHKCTEYLAKKTGKSFQEAKRVNDAKYPIHGHTAFVLERDFGISVPPKQFNADVYGNIDYDRVRAMLTERDVAYARDFLNIWNVDRTNSFVFTNAPRHWVLELNKVLRMPFDDYRILGSDVLGHFKPDPKAYAEAEFFVRLILPHANTFCLVDDSVENVKMAMVLPRWTGTYFS